MLEKRFNFSEIEEKCLESWSKNKTFAFDKKSQNDPFCIMMPPPNITGSLHMGHALTFTLQDILIRFHKKLGKNVLWQPGTDHAGIATEIVVENIIIDKNKTTKRDIGRDKFIEEIWKWKKESGDKILTQMNRLGAAVDWSMSRFTMDKGLSEAVNEVFIDLFNKGMIYKDKRLVNWDPKLETAVSDLEVNQQEKNGKMWFIEYDVENNESIVVGTTRPETIFGDTAIAIHPNNLKYKELAGNFAFVPFLKKKIPIIFDEYADPQKGSGAVKVTPAHDFNDFEIGKKHNLDFINIFDKNAKLNNNVPSKYQGLNRFIARDKIIKDLEQQGRIKKIKDNRMVIPYGDRSGEVIEPFLTSQWFLNTEKICLAVNEAIKKNKINFHPKSWMNTFKHWIKNIEPWCISRQIWWGHRIPVWYSDNGEIVAAKSKSDAIKILKKINNKDKITHQEDDVLDTWFSSALWPFSTLGWPSDNYVLKKFYPTDVLVTGFDIIFFWVARMIMMGLEFMKDIPFKNIYIHPLVKDEKGQKMSKSKGNVIDPIKLIDLYGSDALRLTLANLSTQGQDIKLSDKLVENSRNFITKIWNVARFSQFNNFDFDKNFSPDSCKLDLNRWLLNKFLKTQQKVIKNLELYKFNLVISDLYHFIWNDFCDLYIELSKNYLKEDIEKKEIAGTFNYVFSRSLNLINPVIPFITEKIGIELGYIKKTFFNELLNKDFKTTVEKENIEDFKLLIELIKKIRIEIGSDKRSYVLLTVLVSQKIKWIETNIFLLKSIFNFSEIKYNSKLNKKNKKIIVVSGVKFVLESEESSKDSDKQSLNKKIEYYEKEIQHFSSKLKNKNFIKKAPPKIIQEQKHKLKEAEKNLKLLRQK